MKRFAMLLTILMTCLSLFATNAEAKRLGGGSSFGKQRAVPTQPQRAPDAAPAPKQANPASAQNQPAQNQPAKQGNKWLGPLAGLALGAGLGALLANSGLGGAMGSILLAMLAAGVVLFLISRFAKPKPAPLQTANGASAYSSTEPIQQPVYSGAGQAQPAIYDIPAAAQIPADFPVESFLRGAKTSFIRLQAANDRKDFDDIREYTTPEMFAEISMQMHERDNTPQKTDVVSLNADVIEAVTEGDLAFASVRFTGQLSENNGVPENFDEIWHVQRDLRNEKAGWLLSGIQQTSLH